MLRTSRLEKNTRIVQIEYVGHSIALVRRCECRVAFNRVRENYTRRIEKRVEQTTQLEYNYPTVTAKKSQTFQNNIVKPTTRFCSVQKKKTTLLRENETHAHTSMGN